MKMYISLIIFLFSFGCDALPSNDESQGAATLIIRSGESFGECIGYCQHELEVDGNQVQYKALPNATGPQPAERSYEGEVDQTLWNDLLLALDVATVRQLDDVYGCPDCADGGAEWFEIEDDEGIKRVTFEFGTSPEGVETLVQRLRSFREDMKRQVGLAD